VNYPQSLLSDGEEVEFLLRPHFRALLMPGILLAASIFALVIAANILSDTFLFVPFLVLAGIIFLFGTLIPFLRWLTTQYVFTNRRIITRKGLIARSGRDMPLAKVNNVSFDVTIMGRILNYGSLKIESAADEDNLVIIDVPSVERIQRKIYDLYEEDDARRRGGTNNAHLPSDT
jgi:uncharacterized membrane protein YdbT with pleckstrin-like domain